MGAVGDIHSGYPELVVQIGSGDLSPWFLWVRGKPLLNHQIEGS